MFTPKTVQVPAAGERLIFFLEGNSVIISSCGTFSDGQEPKFYFDDAISSPQPIYETSVYPFAEGFERLVIEGTSESAGTSVTFLATFECLKGEINKPSTPTVNELYEFTGVSPVEFDQSSGEGSLELNGQELFNDPRGGEKTFTIENVLFELDLFLGDSAAGDTLQIEVRNTQNVTGYRFFRTVTLNGDETGDVVINISKSMKEFNVQRSASGILTINFPIPALYIDAYNVDAPFINPFIFTATATLDQAVGTPPTPIPGGGVLLKEVQGFNRAPFGV